MALHEKHIEWLEARGLNVPALIEQFQLDTRSRDGSAWLVLPFIEHGKVVNHKWRKTMAKDFRMDPGAPLTLWNHDALLIEQDKPLIIFEGEIDGMTGVLCGHQRSVSVPNGAPDPMTRDGEEFNPWEAKRYEWVLRHQELLDRVPSFILATDGDDPGKLLASDLARLFGPERCKFVTYPEGCKDANDVYLKYGTDGVDALISGAKEYPVRGLYRLSQFPEPPAFRPVSVGIPGLDNLFPFVEGTFTTISGYAGHGKTSLLMCMLANLIRAGVPIALGSFETMPKPILLQRMRAAIYQCDENDPKIRGEGPADALIEERLGIISNLGVDDDTDLTIEEIINLAKVAVIRDGIRLLVLDPWNEIEHKRGPGENETEYVGRAIRLLKRFARDYQCAVWVVAHPRKPMTDGAPKRPSLYDLAGSAHFANKSDYGLIVHRDDMKSHLVEALLTKKRMGLPGRMGKVTLAYNPTKSGYDLEYDPQS